MHKSAKHLFSLIILFCCLSTTVLAQTKEIKTKSAITSKEIIAPTILTPAKITVTPKTPASAKKFLEPKVAVESKINTDAKVVSTAKKVVEIQKAALKDGISSMPVMAEAPVLPVSIMVDSIALMRDLKVKPFKINAHASYYHDKLNGRRTASGKPFDNKKLTAAHRTLAFGTKLKLTNTANNKSVVVEVTDRGPFTKSREIDLTKTAFMQIATNKSSGSVNITIEVVQ